MANSLFRFGAVLENFEVEDAIHKVLTTKNANATSNAEAMENWDMVTRARGINSS